MQPTTTLIYNASIANEGNEFIGYIFIEGELITEIGSGEPPEYLFEAFRIINADGKLLIPGVIDCHVHFREPGVTHKADIESESKAAVAGGVTSFFEMPNTQPQTTTLSLLEQKMEIAAEKSLANYSFFLGATNNNLEEIKSADPTKVCGVKVFFGASTGNMLVDKTEALEAIFKYSPVPVAAHCEDEATIKANSEAMRNKYGDDVPVEMHPVIRDSNCCIRSSELAISFARKYNTRLHITHLSTAGEISLLDNSQPLELKKITAEVCTHYLHFSDRDYHSLGTKLKVNPAIKSENDKLALLQGLLDGHIDILSTDHAPHLLTEKQNSYFNAPSGTPLVQHSLMAMLEMVKEGKLKLTELVNKMCHSPAICYSISKRGFLRKGYFADLVLVDLQTETTVSAENIQYKCGWSVFEGTTFHSAISITVVNGHIVYEDGNYNTTRKGKQLQFER